MIHFEEERLDTRNEIVEYIKGNFDHAMENNAECASTLQNK